MMFQNPIFKTSIDLEFKATDKYSNSDEVTLYFRFKLMLGLSANQRPSVQNQIGLKISVK